MTQQELAAIVRAVKAEVRKAMSPWLTGGEACAYLKVSPHWMTEHRAELRPRLIGKRWRYHRDALDRALLSPWVDACKREESAK